MKAHGYSYTSHDFRHTGISNLIAKKMPIEKVATYVGHKDIRTTYKYLHTASWNDAINIVKQLQVDDLVEGFEVK
jgi:integrase